MAYQKSSPNAPDARMISSLGQACALRDGRKRSPCQQNYPHCQIIERIDSNGTTTGLPTPSSSTTTNAWRSVPELEKSTTLPSTICLPYSVANNSSGGGMYTS